MGQAWGEVMATFGMSPKEWAELTEWQRQYLINWYAAQQERNQGGGEAQDVSTPTQGVPSMGQGSTPGVSGPLNKFRK